MISRIFNFTINWVFLKGIHVTKIKGEKVSTILFVIPNIDLTLNANRNTCPSVCWIIYCAKKFKIRICDQQI